MCVSVQGGPVSSVAWMGIVFCAFLAYFIVARILNKDNKGALLLGAIVFAAAFFLVSVAGCSVSPERRPWMGAGVAYDTQSAVGHNPACVVRVRAPVGFGPIPPDWLVVGYSHQSSCPDLFDKTTVDQVEIVARIPLGRD